MVAEAYVSNEEGGWEGWVVRPRVMGDTDVLLLCEPEKSWGIGDGGSRRPGADGHWQRKR